MGVLPSFSVQFISLGSSHAGTGYHYVLHLSYYVT